MENNTFSGQWIGRGFRLLGLLTVLALVFGAGLPVVAATTWTVTNTAGAVDTSLRPKLLAGPVLPDAPDWSFYGDGTDSALGAYLSAAGDVNGDGHGDVIVTAPAYRGPGGMHAGRVYLFLGSASGLGATPVWMVQGGPECGNYYCAVGSGVAGAGDVNGDGYDDVIVACNRWTNGQYDEGRVFVYYGSPAGLGGTPNWSAEGNQTMAYYGYAVGTAGDVNGDGYDDIIVGAGASYTVGMNEAFVYLGSPMGLSCGTGCPVDATAAAAWTFSSDQSGANLGWAAGTAGDVNDDGFSDVLVGAPLYDEGGRPDAGKVWVFLGSSTGLSSTPIWSTAGDQAGAELGYALGIAGDVNGDGHDDVLIGAHRYDNGQPDEGRAYLYLGSATGLAATPVWTTESDQANADYGLAIGTAGDLNGDGYADVVVGAHGWDGGGKTDEGKAWVYLGSAAGLAGTAAWTTESGQTGAHIGFTVSTAGDVNGDGVDDLMIGAHQYDQIVQDGGAVFVYHGIRSNQSPVAEANGPYTIPEGGSVTLDGTGSSDPDPGDTLTYAWDLDNDGVFETAGATADFAGLDGPASHPVALQVCDPQAACDTDTATVEVTNVGPTADAGADVTAYRNEAVALSGAWSDPAAVLDEPYVWAWDLDGDGVGDAGGSAAYGATASATASFATEGVYDLTFTVTDADGDNSQDSVSITVLNYAPDCTAAAGSPARLWPPNNKFVRVALGGVTDAEGDPLTLVVTAIRQDEPVGTGNSAPDGKGIGAAAVELRAEKLGSGNGRVYHVSFTAGDGHGGVCTGVVRVAVPHDQAKPAVDGGPLYDSTVPTP